MRRQLIGAALTTALVLTFAPAWALVQPAPGTVLPDYDIRYDDASLRAPGLGLDAQDANQGLKLPVVEPTATQLQAVGALQSLVGSGLRLEFQPHTGVPRLIVSDGRPLSHPSSAEPEQIARDFVRQHADLYRLSRAEIDALYVSRSYPTKDTYHTVWLAQEVNGVRVDRSDLRFGINADGSVVWASAGDVQPGLQVDMTPQLSPEQAVLRAVHQTGFRLDEVPPLSSSMGDSRLVYEPGPFNNVIEVEPLVFPMGGGQGMLAWRVTFEPQNAMPVWYAVTVDARAGRVLQRVNLYKYANDGDVFNGAYPNTVPNPPFTLGVPQTREWLGYQFPSTVGYTIPRPYGQYNFTTGNNVEAKEDLLRDNETTIGAFADGGVNQEFWFPWQDTYANSTGTSHAARIADAILDIDAATTNLFYWNNKWHDIMYAYGFDEASGNFQMDNFGRGGCGGDAIRADAMDGAQPASGNPNLNNANFGTPAEPTACGGNRPRMQMFLWALGCNTGATQCSALRDGDVDNDIIIHEFSHGTSNRLVGGPSVGCVGGTQSGAMGEGWGDWYGANLFSDPKTGEYAVNDPVAGIRNWAMDQNPRTYADLCQGGCQVHWDGEIHASTMWDLRQAVGQDVAFWLVTDGMKFTPCSPSFLDYRHGILTADYVRYGGRYECDIWNVYLARGMGFDAKGADSDYHVADFTFSHPRCSGYAHLRYDSHTTSDTTQGNGDGLYGPGEIIDLDVVLQNFDGVSTASGVTATVSVLTPGVTMVQATRSYPAIPAGGKASPLQPFQFQIDPSFVCGTPLQFSVDISWNPALTRSDDFTDRGGSIPGVTLLSFDAESTTLQTSGPAMLSTAQNHTTGGSQSWYMQGGCYAGDEPTCAGTGPCNSQCAEVLLPAVALPPGQAAVLSFWATYNIEYTWDGIFAQISTDGGSSWQDIATFQYPSQVDGGAAGSCADANTRPGVNGPADNSGLEPWTRFEGDLAAYAGQSVMIRLVQANDGCVYFEGGYIDDIQVSLRNCRSNPYVQTFLGPRSNQDGVNASCSDNDGQPDPGETIDVTIDVTNIGNSTAMGLTGTLTTTNPNVTIDPTTQTQLFGDIPSAGTGTATFRYSVAMTGAGCFEPADFSLALTANGGSYTNTHTFSETLRQDTIPGSWFDDMEGGQPMWTASLGPDGTQQDFAIREMDCNTSASTRYYWSTNIAMIDPTVCASGEPDYSPDSDSLLTSPSIDLGADGALLTTLTWRSGPDPFGSNWGGTVIPGFVEVSIDHDGDGVFTVVANWPMGYNSTNWFTTIDLQNNPAGVQLLAQDTTQFVQVRYRLRATGVDPSAGRDADGLFVDEVRLEWLPCDVNACAPGLPPPMSQSGAGLPVLRSGSGANVP